MTHLNKVRIRTYISRFHSFFLTSAGNLLLIAAAAAGFAPDPSSIGRSIDRVDGMYVYLSQLCNLKYYQIVLIFFFFFLILHLSIIYVYYLVLQKKKEKKSSLSLLRR